MACHPDKAYEVAGCRAFQPYAGARFGGHEPLQYGWDLGKDLDPASHDSSTVGIRFRGIAIAVGIRHPSQLLESGSTVDNIRYRQFGGKGNRTGPASFFWYRDIV